MSDEEDNKLEIVYIVEDSATAKNLEKRMETLTKYFHIGHTGKIHVSEGKFKVADDSIERECVHIKPYFSCGIPFIECKNSLPKGRLIRSKPEYVIFELFDHYYFVNYS